MGFKTSLPRWLFSDVGTWYPLSYQQDQIPFIKPLDASGKHHTSAIGPCKSMSQLQWPIQGNLGLVFPLFDLKACGTWIQCTLLTFYLRVLPVINAVKEQKFATAVGRRRASLDCLPMPFPWMQSEIKILRSEYPPYLFKKKLSLPRCVACNVLSCRIGAWKKYLVGLGR